MLGCIKMKFNLAINDHHHGDWTNPVTNSCDIQTCQINFNTVFKGMKIDLLEAKCRMQS